MLSQCQQENNCESVGLVLELTTSLDDALLAHLADMSLSAIDLEVRGLRWE